MSSRMRWMGYCFFSSGVTIIAFFICACVAFLTLVVSGTSVWWAIGAGFVMQTVNLLNSLSNVAAFSNKHPTIDSSLEASDRAIQRNTVNQDVVKQQSMDRISRFFRPGGSSSASRSGSSSEGSPPAHRGSDWVDEMPLTSQSPAPSHSSVDNIEDSSGAEDTP